MASQAQRLLRERGWNIFPGAKGQARASVIAVSVCGEREREEIETSSCHCDGGEECIVAFDWPPCSATREGLEVRDGVAHCCADGYRGCSSSGINAFRSGNEKPKLSTFTRGPTFAHPRWVRLIDNFITLLACAQEKKSTPGARSNSRREREGEKSLAP